MFKIIHRLVDDEEAVSMVRSGLSNMHRSTVSYILYFQVAHDVVQEFALDGVVYLELRSTPRANEETGES